MAIDATVGGAASDGYIDLATLTAYAAAIGVTLAGDTTSQEADIRRATQYLDRAYVWKGYRATASQALEWPRYIEDYDRNGFVIPSDAIPQPILDACAEVAILYNSGVDPLASGTTSDVVSRKKVKAGPVETETEFKTDSATFAGVRIPAIDGLVGQYAVTAPNATTRIIPWRRG